MGTQYCLILTTEDGDVSVEVLSREVLLERLNQGTTVLGRTSPGSMQGLHLVTRCSGVRPVLS